MATFFTREDLYRAAEAGLLEQQQLKALLVFLESNKARAATSGTNTHVQPRFSLTHVTYYFGALIIMSALGWFMTEAWSRVGPSALLLLALSYMLLTTLLGVRLWREGLFIPSGLLGAVAVSLTPLAGFALLSGWVWPSLGGDYQDYYRWIAGRWIPMEVATVIVGVLMLRLFQFPFIMMPVAIALWFLSMDLSEALYGHEFAWEERQWVSLWFGVVLLLVSFLIDKRSLHDYAFWGYLAGLLAFWGGLSSMDSNSELGKAFYCFINLGLMAISIALRRPMFMVFGGVGVAIYLSHLALRVFPDSLLFPVFLSLLGLGLIVAGLWYQKHRERLAAQASSL
jgi:hypothetical protein